MVGAWGSLLGCSRPPQRSNAASGQVGILDVDLCGPSIPRMLSVGRPDVHQCDGGWVPVYTDSSKSLALMSIGFMLENPDDAVVWRGTKKNGRRSDPPAASQRGRLSPYDVNDGIQIIRVMI